MALRKLSDRQQQHVNQLLDKSRTLTPKQQRVTGKGITGQDLYKYGFNLLPHLNQTASDRAAHYQSGGQRDDVFKGTSGVGDVGQAGTRIGYSTKQGVQAGGTVFDNAQKAQERRSLATGQTDSGQENLAGDMGSTLGQGTVSYDDWKTDYDQKMTEPAYQDYMGNLTDLGYEFDLMGDQQQADTAQQPAQETPATSDNLVQDMIDQGALPIDILKAIIAQQEAQKGIVQDPVVQDPVAQDPIVQDPIVQDPIVQDPVQPLPQDPVVQDPAQDTMIPDPIPEPSPDLPGSPDPAGPPESIKWLDSWWTEDDIQSFQGNRVGNAGGMGPGDTGHNKVLLAKGLPDNVYLGSLIEQQAPAFVNDIKGGRYDNVLESWVTLYGVPREHVEEIKRSISIDSAYYEMPKQQFDSYKRQFDNGAEELIHPTSFGSLRIPRTTFKWRQYIGPQVPIGLVRNPNDQNDPRNDPNNWKDVQITLDSIKIPGTQYMNVRAEKSREFRDWFAGILATEGVQDPNQGPFDGGYGEDGLPTGQDPISGPVEEAVSQDPVSGPVEGPVSQDPISGPVEGPVSQDPVSGPIEGPVSQDPVSGPIEGTPRETYDQELEADAPYVTKEANSVTDGTYRPKGEGLVEGPGERTTLEGATSPSQNLGFSAAASAEPQVQAESAQDIANRTGRAVWDAERQVTVHPKQFTAVNRGSQEEGAGSQEEGADLSAFQDPILTNPDATGIERLEFLTDVADKNPYARNLEFKSGALDRQNPWNNIDPSVRDQLWKIAKQAGGWAHTLYNMNEQWKKTKRDPWKNHTTVGWFDEALGTRPDGREIPKGGVKVSVRSGEHAKKIVEFYADRRDKILANILPKDSDYTLLFLPTFKGTKDYSPLELTVVDKRRALYDLKTFYTGLKNQMKSVGRAWMVVPHVMGEMPNGRAIPKANVFGNTGMKMWIEAGYGKKWLNHVANKMLNIANGDPRWLRYLSEHDPANHPVYGDLRPKNPWDPDYGKERDFKQPMLGDIAADGQSIKPSVAATNLSGPTEAAPAESASGATEAAPAPAENVSGPVADTGGQVVSGFAPNQFAAAPQQAAPQQAAPQQAAPQQAAPREQDPVAQEINAKIGRGELSAIDLLKYIREGTIPAGIAGAEGEMRGSRDTVLPHQGLPSITGGISPNIVDQNDIILHPNGDLHITKHGIVKGFLKGEGQESSSVVDPELQEVVDFENMIREGFTGADFGRAVHQGLGAEDQEFLRKLNISPKHAMSDDQAQAFWDDQWEAIIPDADAKGNVVWWGGPWSQDAHTDPFYPTLVKRDRLVGLLNALKNNRHQAAYTAAMPADYEYDDIHYNWEDDDSRALDRPKIDGNPISNEEWKAFADTLTPVSETEEFKNLVRDYGISGDFGSFANPRTAAYIPGLFEIMGVTPEQAAQMDPDEQELIDQYSDPGYVKSSINAGIAENPMWGKRQMDMDQYNQLMAMGDNAWNLYATPFLELNPEQREALGFVDFVNKAGSGDFRDINDDLLAYGKYLNAQQNLAPYNRHKMTENPADIWSDDAITQALKGSQIGSRGLKDFISARDMAYSYGSIPQMQDLINYVQALQEYRESPEAWKENPGNTDIPYSYVPPTHLMDQYLHNNSLLSVMPRNMVQNWAGHYWGGVADWNRLAEMQGVSPEEKRAFLESQRQRIQRGSPLQWALLGQ